MSNRKTVLASIFLCWLTALLIGRQQLLYARTYQQHTPAIVIEAIYFDAYAYQDQGEAVALRNMGEQAIDINGWRLSDGAKDSAAIENAAPLAPGALVWLTGDAPAFQNQFGHQPDGVLQQWPGFANDGDEVLLINQNGAVVDTVVYGDGETAIIGWSGPAVQTYSLAGVFGREGQILFRKLVEDSGRPASDSNTAADWAQEQSDPLAGKRVRYPGWDLERFFFPVQVQRPGAVRIAIAPDNAYETLLDIIGDARTSIKISSLTAESLALGEALATAAAGGVSVRLLLEGDPAGGIDDHERAVCMRIESAGGQCWFMINDAAQRIHDRYRFLHAKYMIVDNKIAVIGSENLSPNSMPADDKSDGTWGRRGMVVITETPEIVAALLAIYESDLDPMQHDDLFRWQSGHQQYGLPPPSYLPLQNSGGTTYTVRYENAPLFNDVTALILQQSPENMLRAKDGILGLINQAGQGDTLLLQQLQERPHWGPSTSDRHKDPNLRLEALIAAARRGAAVRLLLDSYFDVASGPLSNAAACDLVNQLAHTDKLRMACQLANPTGLGIHNKMILANIDGRGYVHAGSWNGTELAGKGNREVAILLQSNKAYDYLAEMFDRDWPRSYYVPLVYGSYSGFVPHALISEVLYDPYGPDESEFIEIVNPTLSEIDLSDFSIGDAVDPHDFEDVRRFPPGTALPPGAVIVVSTSAAAFQAQFGVLPDFELFNTMELVPDLIDDPSWGDPATFLRLGNEGDEVILRDSADQVVDVLTYGAGSFPQQVPCPLLSGASQSLERYPYWIDTDSCPADFRAWPFPSPGALSR